MQRRRYTSAMNPSYEEVLKTALPLTTDERERLAEDMYTSVAEESPEELDAYWIAEVQRRAKEVDEGKVKMLDGDEVMARLRI
jgi:putative addiction module component (TIGR02574 family)